MNRKEHLQWCKDRAMEYVDKDDVANAFISMASDLGKHPETADHAGIKLGLMLRIAGELDTPIKMRDFIEGFN